MRVPKLISLIGVTTLALSLSLANAQDATPTTDEIQGEIAQLRERILELEAQLPPTEMEFGGTGADLGDMPIYLSEGRYRVTASCEGDSYAYFEGIPASNNETQISLITVQDSHPTDAPLNVRVGGEYFINAACNGSWQITIQPLVS